MAQKEKIQIIAERINEYFKQILELKASDKMRQYLDFCKRVREQSAFNNTIVFIQKPDCFYYATASQWKKRFNRIPKNLARPLLVLFPFAPVEFVYDLEDTDGEPLPKDLIYWWREGRGDILKDALDNLFHLCHELRIITKIAPLEYITYHSHQTFGIASKDQFSKDDIELHPRYSNSELTQEAFGVLVHEVAHHLLGHLGEKSAMVRVRDKNRTVIIARATYNNDRSVKEVEAEITAWLVFARFGAEKRSSAYLAGWLTKQATTNIRMNEICKAVDNIYKMAQGEEWWIKKAKRAEKEAMANIIRFGSA